MLSSEVETEVVPVLGTVVGAPETAMGKWPWGGGAGGEGHAEEQELLKSLLLKSRFCRLRKSLRGLTFCEGTLLWISIHSTPCRNC